MLVEFGLDLLYAGLKRKVLRSDDDEHLKV